MRDPKLPAVGSTHDGYEIIDGNFLAFPLGKIQSGPNKGTTVILTSFKVEGSYR